MDSQLAARLARQRAKEEGYVSGESTSSAAVDTPSRLSSGLEQRRTISGQAAGRPGVKPGASTPSPETASTGGTRTAPATPGSSSAKASSSVAYDPKIDKKLQELMQAELQAKEAQKEYSEISERYRKDSDPEAGSRQAPDVKDRKAPTALQSRIPPHDLLAKEAAPPPTPPSRVSRGTPVKEALPPTPPSRATPDSRCEAPSPPEPKLEPKLQQRLAQQLAKEDSEIVVPDVSTASKLETKMEARLQSRMEQQLAKEGDKSRTLDGLASAAKIEKKFEPVLERRMQLQLAKEEGKAQALPESLERTDKIVTKLDPKLARRLDRQQQKLVTGETDVQDYQMRDHRIACQSDLERRMAKQREKVITGISEVGNVGSAAQKQSRVNDELAQKFERRRQIEEELERKARGESETSSGRKRDRLCLFGRHVRQMMCMCGGRAKEARRLNTSRPSCSN